MVKPEYSYSPLPYLNPFKAWLPFPLLRFTTEAVKLDGLGLISYLSDPTDTETAILSTAFNWNKLMAEVDLQWTSLAFGHPLSFNLSDTLTDFGETTESIVRQTRLELAYLYDTGLSNERNRLNLSPSLGFLAVAFNPADGSGAYQWAYDSYDLALGLSVGFSFNRRRLAWQIFGSGSTVSISSNYLINRLFGAVSYRAAINDSHGGGQLLANGLRAGHSVVLKLGAVLSGTPVAALPLNFAPYFWTALKLVDLTDNKLNKQLVFGFGWDYRW